MSCSNPSKKQTANANISIWLLTGHKPGDNNQLLALAQALGWPFESKQLIYHRHELLTNRLLGATLSGIDRRRSSRLEPPWPDLVISAGRRNEPVARWIRKQADKNVRLVHIGRPWAPLDQFDLIITTPQYSLPARRNILNNQLPLHTVSAAGLQQAARQWREHLSHLKRPFTATLLGGNSGPFVFTADKGRRLGKMVNELAAAQGGSLLVTDSARTPDDAFAAFHAELTRPAHIYRWGSGEEDNPYLAYLGLADQLVVTGESMSMLAEASATGKPLYLFDLGAEACPWWRYRHNFRFKPLSHRIAMKLGPQRMRRDINRIQHALITSGRAVWLGEPFPSERRIPPADDIGRAVARVRALFVELTNRG